jgi:hypothetical protein
MVPSLLSQRIYGIIIAIPRLFDIITNMADNSETPDEPTANSFFTPHNASGKAFLKCKTCKLDVEYDYENASVEPMHHSIKCLNCDELHDVWIKLEPAP